MTGRLIAKKKTRARRLAKAKPLEGKALIFGGNGLSVELKMVVKMPAMMVKIA